MDELNMYGSHGTYWIPEGLPNESNILFFNIGHDRPDGFYSTIEMLKPLLNQNEEYQLNQDSNYLPMEGTLVYKAPNPEDFLAPFLSNAQQLPNGNILINEGTKGYLFEINNEGEKVWDYTNPVGQFGIANQYELPLRNSIFRAYKYGSDYPGLQGKKLSPMNSLEGGSPVAICDPTSTICSPLAKLDFNFTYDSYQRLLSVFDIPIGDFTILLTDLNGRTFLNSRISDQIEFSLIVPQVESGVYFIHLLNERRSFNVRKLWVPN